MDNQNNIESLNLSRWQHLSIITVFCLVLLLPGLAMVLPIDRSEKLKENRNLTEAPKIPKTWEDVEEFSGASEAWFNDHFGFRSFFIRSNSLIRVLGLGMAPQTSISRKELMKDTVDGRGFPWPRVLIGKDGFLFNTYNRVIDSQRNKWPLDDRFLRSWIIGLAERTQYCSLRNSIYMYAIVPNKHTIYPEKLPLTIDYYTKKSRRETLGDFLHENSNLVFLDPTEEILAEKERGVELYYRTDTHWNERGAIVAAIYINRAIREYFPEVGEIRLEDYEEERIEGGRSGDLAQLMGLNRYLREDNISMKPLIPPSAKLVKEKSEIPKVLSSRPAVVFRTGKTELPRAIIMHDSFTLAMQEVLAEQFEEVVFVWDHRMQVDLINSYKPDLVMSITVERYTTGGHLQNPKELRGILSAHPPKIME